MILEQLTSQLNATTFWKEFTFSETKFFPRPRQEAELADGIVRIGPLAFVFQMKERTDPTDNPEVERRWFRQKVLRKAKDQIKDSIRYLAENPTIRLANARGHQIEVAGADLTDIKRIIVYMPGAALPEECLRTKHLVSSGAGFVHLIAANDYLGVLDKLRVPDDVRLYFDYREAVLPRLHESGASVEEPDIIVGFLLGWDLPRPGSIEKLQAFVQDRRAFDISDMLGELHSHIVNPDGGTNYYRILEEFARVPRSVWREFKTRLMRCLDAARKGQAIMPYRFAFPRSDCTFIVATHHPEIPATGPEGEKERLAALTMYTQCAKYESKTANAVGLLISKDGKHSHLDWCLVQEPWVKNEQIEAFMTRAQLFRPSAERKVDSFLFRGDVDLGT